MNQRSECKLKKIEKLAVTTWIAVDIDSLIANLDDLAREGIPAGHHSVAVAIRNSFGAYADG